MTTQTVVCDSCAGSGMEPEVLGMDGVPIDLPVPCRSCLGQQHVEQDVLVAAAEAVGKLEWVHPDPTADEMLDWVEAQGNGNPWAARQSDYGRGFRLHNSSSEERRTALHATARKAIAAAMRAGK